MVTTSIYYQQIKAKIMLEEKKAFKHRDGKKVQKQRYLRGVLENTCKNNNPYDQSEGVA